MWYYIANSVKNQSVHSCLITHAICSMMLYQWPNTKFRVEYFTNPGHINFLTDTAICAMFLIIKAVLNVRVRGQSLGHVFWHQFECLVFCFDYFGNE